MRKPKTWKRELAALAAIAWCLLTARYFFLSDAALAQAMGGAYFAASASLWSFIGAMFGMHAVLNHKGEMAALEVDDPPAPAGGQRTL